MYCIQCGKVVAPQDAFCISCGTRTDLSAAKFMPEDIKYQYPTEKPICKKCNTELPIRAAFCPKCGEKHDNTENPLPLCVVCGKPLTPGSTFCIGCGMKYIPDEQGVIEIAKPRCCEACGEEATENSAFCIACGKPLPEKSAPEKLKILPVCAACNAPYRKNAHYCADCGHTFSRPNAPQRATTCVPYIVNGKITCPICGEGKQPANRLCCWSCGAVFRKQ